MKSGSTTLLAVALTLPLLFASYAFYGPVVGVQTSIVDHRRKQEEPTHAVLEPGRLAPPSPPLAGRVDASLNVPVVSPMRSNRSHVRGVILFLYGGNKSAAFFRHKALGNLYKHMLLRHPYPVHIFHEGLQDFERSEMQAALPGVDLTLEDVGYFWRQLPGGVTSADIDAWRRQQALDSNRPVDAIQGAGYRIMCRFWFGLVWNLESLNKYDYYWRMDSDSLLVGPVMEDPFKVMFQRRCEYGWREQQAEKGYIDGMYAEFKRWLRSNAVAEFERSASSLPPPVDTSWSAGRAIAAVNTFNKGKTLQLSRPKDIRNTRRFSTLTQRELLRSIGMKVFYNNFEMGTFRLKRHPIYQSYFRWVDEQEPYGILRYRWGDAPLHTIAVLAVLQSTNAMCQFRGNTVPYIHPANAKIHAAFQRRIL